MKRTLLISLILCVLLVFAGSAWSLQVINYPGLAPGAINVGGLDNFIDQTNLPPGNNPTAELTWVKNALLAKGYDPNVDFLGKLEAGSGMILQPVYDGVNLVAGVYAQYLVIEPEYFLLKLGSGNNAYEYILFKNNTEFDWGVIALSTTEYTILNVGSISHVSEFGVVPEPMSVLLLGLGLVGLAGVRRFRK